MQEPPLRVASRHSLSEEEHAWAIALRDRLQSSSEELSFTPTDFDIASYAIVCRGDVQRGMDRLLKLNDTIRKYDLQVDHDGSTARRTVKIQPGQLYAAASQDRLGRAILPLVARMGRPSDILALDPSGNLHAQGCFELVHCLGPDLDAVRAGIVSLYDGSSVGWSNMSLTTTSIEVDIFQKSGACKVKQIVLVDLPMVARIFLRTVSPLLKQKMRDRLHLISMDEIASIGIDVASLPPAFGGQATTTLEEWIAESLARRKESQAAVRL